MFKYIIFLFFPINLFAQGNIENYIRNNTTAVRTVEPDSMNYADLEVIGKAIGNSKVVFLGEQDHGDAPTFLAKTRIIKYLHERKGFDVIAFESDFFSLTYGWEHLDKTKEAIDSFISGNIFGVWTLCNACNQLMYHYIPDSYKTDNALIISGFDNQLFFGYKQKYDVRL
jgi:erythromycin esterase